MFKFLALFEQHLFEWLEAHQRTLIAEIKNAAGDFNEKIPDSAVIWNDEESTQKGEINNE